MPEPMSGCWLWLGGLHKGYGCFQSVSGKTIAAYKWAYEFFVGEVPIGLELDHKCRNKTCVNPQHLEPVTHAENMYRVRKTHCSRGHPLEPARSPSWKGYQTCYECRKLRKRIDWSKSKLLAVAEAEGG